MMGCCKSCSLALYGEDHEDFAGMASRSLADAGYGLLADCEECGPVLVDHDGRSLQPEPYDA